ncbi:MAG: hypothetical protein IJW41_01350 [Oscillospiraceae bacterium]|nr:hypothetical protein [Oscillospiraceae bacterium]
MEMQKEEKELNLIDLFCFLKTKIWIMVGVFVLFFLAGTFYTKATMPDEYTAVTRMYVLSRSSESSVSYYDYSVSTYMVRDYQVLITGQNVTSEVIRRLDLRMSPSQLASKISVSAIESTRVLQIVVTDTDPQRAADIANCVREVSSTQIKDIMDADAVNLVYKAEVPSGKSGPDTSKIAFSAALIGLVITVAVLLLIYFLDDTIRTEEDVMYRLGLGTLGVIPISSELEALGNTGSVQRKKKKLFGFGANRRK